MAKSTRKKKALAVATPDVKPSLGSMPNIPVAAVFSFLKDKRGALSWTLRELTRTLNISEQDARSVLTILKLQGYVSETSDNELLTTVTPREPASGRDQVNYFLKQLRGKSRFLNLRPYEPWMSRRSHRSLL